jgi:hypothetical protein
MFTVVFNGGSDYTIEGERGVVLQALFFDRQTAELVAVSLNKMEASRLKVGAGAIYIEVPKIASVIDSVGRTSKTRRRSRVVLSAEAPVALGPEAEEGNGERQAVNEQTSTTRITV